MRSKWECEDYEDALQIMSALETLGHEYVFYSDSVEGHMALGVKYRRYRYLVELTEPALIPEPEQEGEDK